jgi:hypothetical protein
MKRRGDLVARPEEACRRAKRARATRGVFLEKGQLFVRGGLSVDWWVSCKAVVLFGVEAIRSH